MVPFGISECPPTPFDINQLHQPGALSRQRSRVRVSSSPPFPSGEAIPSSRLRRLNVRGRNHVHNFALDLPLGRRQGLEVGTECDSTAGLSWLRRSRDLSRGACERLVAESSYIVCAATEEFAVRRTPFAKCPQGVQRILVWRQELKAGSLQWGNASGIKNTAQLRAPVWQRDAKRSGEA